MTKKKCDRSGSAELAFSAILLAIFSGLLLPVQRVFFFICHPSKKRILLLSNGMADHP